MSSIHYARPSVIGQRPGLYNGQYQPVRRHLQPQGDAGTILLEKLVLSNIISYNNILIDTSYTCRYYVTDSPRYITPPPLNQQSLQ